jgi:dTDP-4-dehydrorhamnose 3,5-epimerase
MTDFRILEEPMPDLYLLEFPRSSDERGDFTKIFHVDSFKEKGIDFFPAELFLTRSKAGVLRGMHFQHGPAAHSKLVFCSRGRVLDVVVDIRQESLYFNRPFALELSETSNRALLIGKGYAHGFLALEDESWMFYATTTVHCPSLDRGVLWSSIAFDWPLQKPVLSARDCQHPSIYHHS